MTPNPDWLEILRAAHHEPLDPAHYTAVRARVLAEIEASRKPWRRFAWISGIAAATAAAALLLLTLAPPLGRPQLAPLPNIAFAVPAAPPVPASAAAVPLPRPKREPLTIQLQTSDPNIVIYWIAE